MQDNGGCSSSGFSFAGQLQLNTKPNTQTANNDVLVNCRFIVLRPIVAVGGLSHATGFNMTASVAMGCNLVKKIP